MKFGGLTLQQHIIAADQINTTYGPVDVHDEKALAKVMVQSRDLITALGVAPSIVTFTVSQMITLWHLMWANCGFPHIILKPKRAAYLASTQVRSECSQFLEPPWPAFLVVLPDTDWSTTDEFGDRHKYTGLSVMSHNVAEDDPRIKEAPYEFKAGRRNWSYIGWTGPRETTLFRHEFSFDWDSRTTDPTVWPEIPSDIDQTQEDLYMSLVFCQLIAGLALEIESIPNTLEKAKQRAKAKAHRDLIKNTSCKLKGATPYLFGEDVVIDARPVIADYIQGRARTSPVCKSYVRPHPRRQRIGPNRSQVKSIRIDGYWKGAPDAPVRIRAHKFNDS